MSDIDARTAHDAVAELLWRLEAQLDEALATGGELLASLPTARRASKLPAIAGQAAVQHFSQTLLAISEARGHVVAGHRVVEKVGKQIGYETSYGDEGPKEGFAPTGADANHLRVAA